MEEEEVKEPLAKASGFLVEFKGGEHMDFWSWLYKKQNEALRKIIQGSAFSHQKSSFRFR